MENLSLVSENKLDKINALARNGQLLDAIRRAKCGDKKLLSRISGLSWPTVNGLLEEGTTTDSLMKAKKELSLLTYYNKKSNTYELISDAGYMLGIAIGAKETKITIIDFSFKPVKYFDNGQQTIFFDFAKELINSEYLAKYINVNIEEWINTDISQVICFQTCNNLEYISEICNTTIKLAIQFFNNNNNIDLLGIGLTFPGVIETDSLCMRFCPNISSLNNVCLLNLISKHIQDELLDAKISLYIGHDTTAITVFEKESFYLDSSLNDYADKENIVCLYLGMGLGMGIIVNNQILFGANNSIGEIGHLPAPDAFKEIETISREEEQDKISSIKSNSVSNCYCNISNCIEKMIRTKAFNCKNHSEYAEATTEEKLLCFADEHPFRYRVLKYYLQYICSIIINILNPNVIVLCGKTLNSIPQLKHDKYIIKQSTSLSYSAANCEIINGHERADVVAIGAAILSYYKATNPTTTLGLIDQNRSDYKEILESRIRKMMFEIYWKRIK